MNNSQKKDIYILLTRTTTILSRAVHIITSDEYTHASIAFNETLQPLYSSSRKNGRTLFPAGPCMEIFSRGYWKYHPHVPCAVYKLEVSEEVYNKAQIEVKKIMDKEHEYHFNIIGLLLCRLNIPYHREKNYFCSQFVSDILQKSNALELPKQPCLMRPSDYMELPQLKCCFKGYLSEFKSKLEYKDAVQYM